MFQISMKNRFIKCVNPAFLQTDDLKILLLG